MDNDQEHEEHEISINKVAMTVSTFNPTEKMLENQWTLELRLKLEYWK